MSSDRADAAVLTCRFDDGRGKRLIFEPLDAGGLDVQERIATNGGWKPGGPWGVAETVVLENAHVLQRDAATDSLRARLETAFERVGDARAREELRQALQLLDAVEAGL